MGVTPRRGTLPKLATSSRMILGGDGPSPHPARLELIRTTTSVHNCRNRQPRSSNLLGHGHPVAMRLQTESRTNALLTSLRIVASPRRPRMRVGSAFIEGIRP